MTFTYLAGGRGVNETLKSRRIITIVTISNDNIVLVTTKIRLRPIKSHV